MCPPPLPWRILRAATADGLGSAGLLRTGAAVECLSARQHAPAMVLLFGGVVQPVEQRTFNPSNPSKTRHFLHIHGVNPPDLPHNLPQHHPTRSPPDFRATD